MAKHVKRSVQSEQPSQPQETGQNQAQKKIVVAGDAAVDWFFFPVEKQDEGENWKLFPAARPVVLPGGALLLGEFVKYVAGAYGLTDQIVLPESPYKLENVSPTDLIHSNALVGKFPFERDDPEKREVLRIRESFGYVGPEGVAPASPLPKGNPLHAEMVVLDDAGNGFREQEGRWPAAISNNKRPLVVHKMRRPLKPGTLWKKLAEPDNDRHIVVIGADDLRTIPGAEISKSLSWEATAKDFVYQIQINEKLSAFQRCQLLIVNFGVNGAIVYRRGAKPQAQLIFDPFTLEGDAAKTMEGTMFGLTSAFTARLAVELALKGTDQAEEIVKGCLGSMRAVLQLGFVPKTLNYPLEQIFAQELGTPYEIASIEPATDLIEADLHNWRILDQKTRTTRRLAAEELTRNGKSQWLQGVPVGKFGDNETIDRAEIESYSAIRELMEEFLRNPEPKRPLCFSVFGPPGSGKSFGVKQVRKSLGKERTAELEFNVSQFLGYKDVVAALHKVRDVALSGKVPFVFFDEFDAANQEGPLGWLKYFLAPMQDGKFREEGEVHPIGKAIFVFAGGTRDTYLEFAEQGDSNSPVREKFQQAKGPDFLSRLRGFINVMGPNRQGEDDDAFIIRRAKVLRSMLLDNSKAKGLFNSQQELSIDDAILRAMLHVTKYKHGTRSIESILDMSQLAGEERFELSALPTWKQLDLHVDADEFFFLASRERFYTVTQQAPETGSQAVTTDNRSVMERDAELVELIAQKIHQDYVRHRTLEEKLSDTVVDFSQLTTEKQNSNRDAAADIAHKLFTINHGIRSIGKTGEPRIPDITAAEVEWLAHWEHERWNREQRVQGYILGEKQPGQKISPYLKPYAEIPREIQQYDIQAVLKLPKLLADLGYEIFRMQEDTFSDTECCQKLSEKLPEEYVLHPAKEGDASLSAAELRGIKQDHAILLLKGLSTLGYDFRVAKPKEELVWKLTPNEAESLAEIRHMHWLWRKVMQDWIHHAASEFNQKKKYSPYLVPWADLRTPEEPKAEKDAKDDQEREQIELLQVLKVLKLKAYEQDLTLANRVPEFLLAAGYVVEKLAAC